MVDERKEEEKLQCRSAVHALWKVQSFCISDVHIKHCNCCPLNPHIDNYSGNVSLAGISLKVQVDKRRI